MPEMEEAIDGLEKVVKFLNIMKASDITIEVGGYKVKVSLLDEGKEDGI